MIKESSINGIFEIKDKKSDFSKTVNKISEPNEFKNFIYLFQRIDSLTGKKYNYIE